MGATSMPNATAMRYVTEVRTMPRGRKPDGAHALSNAERQARYRARRLSQPTPVVTRARPTDRRSRPNAGAMPSSSCWRYRPNMPTGSPHSPTACATAPRPTHSKPSSISTLQRLPTSSCHAASAVTDRTQKTENPENRDPSAITDQEQLDSDNPNQRGLLATAVMVIQPEAQPESGLPRGRCQSSVSGLPSTCLCRRLAQPATVRLAAVG